MEIKDISTDAELNKSVGNGNEIKINQTCIVDDEMTLCISKKFLGGRMTADNGSFAMIRFRMV